MTAREKEYVRAANRSVADFEMEYIRDHPRASGPTLATKYAIYSNLDPDGKYSPTKDEDSGNKAGSTAMGSPTTLGGWVQKGLATQFKTNVGMAEHEFQDMNSVLSILLDNEGKIKNMGTIIKDMAKNIGEGIVLNFQQQNELLMEINENTGMLGDLSKRFREEITEAYPAAIKLGISFDVLSSAVSDLVANSGKFRLLSRETIEEMALASKFATDMGEYAAMAGNFERVSMGIYDMTQATNEAGLSALQIGLNSRRTVKDLNDNLYMLNQYGFKDGVEGLTRMVQKSIEFRFNMNSAATLAEKVWSPEGALEFVSNMQVIGGAMGDFNDPIKLMYMATNNVEGLQDAILEASKSLVTYNNEQGRFEITGANLRRAKAMADELGMSMADLTQTAVASMERTQAASDLMSQGLTIDEEDREFLTNLSQMKEGRMVIEVPKSLQDSMGKQTEIALDTMTEEQAKLLLDQREAFKDLTMEDVALQQVSLIENINRDVSFLTATARIQAGKLGNMLTESIGFDPAAIAIEAAGLVDKFGEKMDVNVIMAAMNKEFDTNMKPSGKVEATSPTAMNTTPAKTETPTTEEKKGTTQTINSTITLRSDVNYDQSRRDIMNSPLFISQWQNAYIEKFQQK